MVTPLLLLALVAFWGTVGWWMPLTTDAWLNAPLVVVRAGQAGQARLTKQIGEAVADGDAIAQIVDEAPDRTRLERLETERSIIRAERARILSELETAEDLAGLSRQQLDEYRELLTDSLQASLRKVDAEHQELAVLHGRAHRILGLTRELLSRRAASPSELAGAVEDLAAVNYRLVQAQENRARIDIELEGARRYVFIQRESPIYLTWSKQVLLSIPQLRARVVEVEARLAAVGVEIGLAEEQVERLARATISAPVRGVVWRRTANWGPVAKGESLLEIADVRSPFVEAQFKDSYARSLYPEARAIVVFRGRGALPGTVRAVRQTNPSETDWGHAIKLPRRLDQVRVIIDLDDRSIDAKLLGQRCRVLVIDKHPGPLQRFAEALYRFLRW